MRVRLASYTRISNVETLRPVASRVCVTHRATRSRRSCWATCVSTEDAPGITMSAELSAKETPLRDGIGMAAAR